ncbi:coth-domain-containing protein [Neocallimastix lanati (nom. inval.)]|jgi:hypothetical protein|nr:coth-domain-containing protein [Neocallimastix sp. JGI-2020a]
MKVLLFIPLYITSVLCSYLSGLDRTFSEAEFKVVDLYVTMPEFEIQNLIQSVQHSENQVQMGRTGEDFKYQNATIVAKWNGNEKVYENVSFKTGGMYARVNDKVGFNIKLPKKFLGRKNIRIRPDPSDRTHLRSKLCCDMANRLGLPSIQAIYARLYMNEEYWGLYTLMDSIKTSWIKQTFNPSVEEITTLIQCKSGGADLAPGTERKCVNANDDYPNMDVFKQFVDEINAAKTIEEVEKILDVDVFLKFMAMEWLIGSFDHFLVLGHNFYFYKRESDGKWIIIEYDYDNTFGNGLSNPTYWNSKKNGGAGGWNFGGAGGAGGANGWNFGGAGGANGWNFGGAGGAGGANGWNLGGAGGAGADMGNNNNVKLNARAVEDGVTADIKPNANANANVNVNANNGANEVVHYTFDFWELNRPIIDVLVHKNPERFKKIVHDVLVSAFNPSILNERIDELKEFLLPYVEEDSTPKDDGSLPGRINKAGKVRSASVSEFESEIENKLKEWIKIKFEVACEEYGLDGEEIIRESASFVPKSYDYGNNENNKAEKEDGNDKVKAENDEAQAEASQGLTDEAQTEADQGLTDEAKTESNQALAESNQSSSDECWSDVLGYSCCKKNCYVYYTDKDGKWGVEDNQWCGIIESVCEPKYASSQCYGETTKEYPCCEGCKTAYRDNNGKWGYENNNWCSIKYSCK